MAYNKLYTHNENCLTVYNRTFKSRQNNNKILMEFLFLKYDKVQLWYFIDKVIRDLIVVLSGA